MGPVQQWHSLILHDEKDRIRRIAANAITILVYDERWKEVLAYDEFAETIVTTRPPPWRSVDAPKEVKPGDWTDADTIRTQSWLAAEHGLDIGEQSTIAAVSIVALRHRVHPVREWLDSLRWDGVKRAPTWLIDIMGVEDTPLVRAVSCAWLVSAAARIYRPGCKVDTVLVLEGKPGIHKSSVLRAIAGDDWFLEMSIADVAAKDAMQLLRRKWLVEFPEIDGLSRSEQAHVKAYFSRQVDTYRPSYGKGARDFPRQAVFAATTNKDQYLVDETGGAGRRMWPFWCTKGDLSLASSMRDQLWAEARARLESGEEWHLMDPELLDAERGAQDARFRSDPWEQTIAVWLAKPADIGSRATQGVTTADVLAGAIGQDVSKRTHADASRVGAVLRRLGWVPSKHPESRDGARVRLYRPQEGAATNGHTLLPLETDPPETLPEYDTEDLFPPVDAGEH